MDLATLAAALQRMQDGQVLLQQQLAATLAESAQAQRQQTEMAATLVALRAQNETLVNERRESIAVLGGIPAALARLGAAKEKSQMLMDSRSLGKPSILNSIETEDRVRMWVSKADGHWQKKAAEGGAKGKSGKGGKGKGKGGKGKGINAWELDEWPEWPAAEGEALCGLEVVEKASLDLSPHEPDWTACNFDTGAAVTALPKGADAKANGSSYRTASGEFIEGYGPGTLAGKDELGKGRTINGELADVHKVLISASATHAKGHFTWLEKGGGYIIQERSDLGRELRRAFEAAVKKHGL